MNNYLKIKLETVSETTQGTTTNNKIVIIATEQIFDDSVYPNSLLAKIKQASNDKNNAVVTHWQDDRLVVFAIVVKKSAEQLRLLGANVFKIVDREKLETVTLTEADSLDSKEIYAFAEGLILSSYCFTKYKKGVEKTITTIHISNQLLDPETLNELVQISQATALTKNLVNEPLNKLNALAFAETAVSLGKTHGFKTTILHKEEIESLKMGGLLGVNMGSETPPTFTILEYKPENAVNSDPLVLVGKGVMFDTGGYSLKVGGSMAGMKSDMSGGAAVLGTFAAIASNKLPYHVVGLIPATDNMISSTALVVDDVITMMDGTTVEVLNTDAEGRLILADALTYAKRFNPELVIDMATLTGAAAAITGPYGIAMAGNNQESMTDLMERGETVYERLFQLPFWSEYEDLLKSSIADLKNIGGKVGGATTAAKFLEHFTDYPWIHLDIAGPAFLDDAKGYRQSGGTAVPVRLLYEFIKQKSIQESASN